MPLATVAAVVPLGALGAFATLTDDEGEPEPNCLEEALSQGVTYRHDPALGIALSRAITYDDPALVPIVDAVADYQRNHPDDRGIHLDDSEDLDGDAVLRYVTTLHALERHPDLATPDLLAALQEQARTAGLAGVNNVVADEVRYPDDQFGGGSLDRLRHEVLDARNAIEDGGISPFPFAGCQIYDVFDDEE